MRNMSYRLLHANNLVWHLLFFTCLILGTAGNAQVVNSIGGKIYVSGGNVKVNGNILLDTASVFHNYGNVHSDSVKSSGTVELKEQSVLQVEKGLYLTKGYFEVG